MNSRVSRQVVIVLIGLFLLVLSLSACSSQIPTSGVTNTPAAETAQVPTSPPPTEIPQALPTATPEPTEASTPTSSPLPPTSAPTAEPTLAVTEVEAELTIGSTRVSEVDQMEQVYVPSGEFIMGSESPEAKRTIEGGRAYPEIPVHTVFLDGYWIDKYEVTTSQYAACVDAGVCRAPWETSADMYPNYYGNEEYANYPVIWINWSMARNYCEWVGRRLPTEAEWEKAARGTDGQLYPWGNDPISGERANFCDVNCDRTIANGMYDDGYVGTAPVGSYPAGASPYGAMDMSGNVWEWVSSLIMPYPYDANDGREDLDSPGERAWRGGPYSNGIWWMRSSVRYRSVPTYWWMVLGFRCASSK